MINELGDISLQPTEATDLDLVLGMESDSENKPFIAQWPRERHLAAIKSPSKLHWLIRAAPEKQVVGYVILEGLDNPSRNLEFTRIVIGKKGRGYGKQTLQLVMTNAFEHCGTHRLWLDVMEHNERARHVYRSMGFREEATLRESMHFDGEYVSLVVMAMLEQEYYKRQSAAVF